MSGLGGVRGLPRSGPRPGVRSRGPRCPIQRLLATVRNIAKLGGGADVTCERKINIHKCGASGLVVLICEEMVFYLYTYTFLCEWTES